MYESKQKLANTLYETLDTIMVSDDNGEVSINKLLNPQQKYSLLMQLINSMPKTDFENVLEFQRAFQVKQETTHIVEDFAYANLRFRLLLEEVLELGFSLGLSNIDLYYILIDCYNKVETDKPEPNLTNVLDALTDILFVAYGAVDTFNLTDVQHEAMQEVTRSNLSKLIPRNDSAESVIKESVAYLKNQGKEVLSIDLKNGFYAIQDRVTNKILKPLSYSKPDLQTIINKYLKTI